MGVAESAALAALAGAAFEIARRSLGLAAYLARKQFGLPDSSGKAGCVLASSQSEQWYKLKEDAKETHDSVEHWARRANAGSFDCVFRSRDEALNLQHSMNDLTKSVQALDRRFETFLATLQTKAGQ